MLAVNRTQTFEQIRPATCGRSTGSAHHQLAAGDHRLLVRDRDRDTRIERVDRCADPNESGGRRDEHVRLSIQDPAAQLSPLESDHDVGARMRRRERA